jgi:hypothetical protein
VVGPLVLGSVPAPRHPGLGASALRDVFSRRRCPNLT